MSGVSHNKVIKRNGEEEPVDFNKILLRIRNLCALNEDIEKLQEINPEKYKINKALTPLRHVRYEEIAQTVIAGMKNHMSTSELDDLAACIAQPRVFDHPEYGTLAARIVVSNYHKNNIYNLYEHFRQSGKPDDAALTPEAVEKRLFWYTIRALYENIDANGDRAPLVHPRIYQLVRQDPDYFEQVLNYANDYYYDYAGFKLLEETYLLRCALRDRNGVYRRVPVERPQHLIMRVALGIHCSSQYKNWKRQLVKNADVWQTMQGVLRECLDDDLFAEAEKQYRAGEIDWHDWSVKLPPEEGRLLRSIVKENSLTWEELAARQPPVMETAEAFEVIETYELMSQMYMTHATPTLFNAGTLMPQLSSCYLIQPSGDSMQGITKYWADCAEISKWAGGIGSHVHNIRATNSYIRGTNGRSNGLVPMLKVVDDISVYVDQCFGPDTMVYTEQGPKKIADITIGTKLVTHDGSFRAVAAVRQFPHNGKVCCLGIKQSLEPVIVTGQHPFLTVKLQKGQNFSVLLNRLENGYEVPTYVPAGDLGADHLIGIPIPTFEQDFEQYTEDDCYMYGLLLGDGSISKDLKTFAVHMNNTTKVEYADFVRSYLTFAQIDYYEAEENSSVKISWYRNGKFKFTRAMLYDTEDNKVVHPTMLHLPRNKTLKIIQGLLQTAGTYRGKEILLELASRPLVEAVRYMLLRLGIGSSGYTRNRVGESHITKHGRRITTKQPTAVLRVPKVAEICDLLGIESGKFVTYVKHDGMIWSRVESKEFIDYEGVLTDFDIDTNHNYLTHVGLAHNGGGKRPGSHAIYLSPHHADIHRVLDLKRQRGNDQERARHLFYAMWMPDEFYRCIQEEARLEAQWRKEGKTDTPKLWYLMCPDQSPGLDDLFDAELAVSYLNDNQVDPVKHAFTHLYRKYIAAGRYVERVSAQELWRHICEVVEETGIPYICDKDAGNRKSNQQNLGTIKSSNLCVAPETMILTKKGYYPIADLVDQQVQVWNGSEWSRTTVRQTSENAELLKIKFSDGAEIQCTRKHKFYIKDGNSMMEYAAEELTSGLKLIKFDLPDDVIDQEDEFLHPYSHGFFCGDGLYTNTGTGEICQYRALPEGAYCVRHKDWSLSNDVHQTMCQAKIGHQPIAWLYGEKKALFDYLDLVNYSTEDDQQGRQRVQFHPLIAEKFVVPLNCSRTVKIQWFAGYCDADGTLAKNGNNISLQVGSVNYEFLMRIRLMLQTMGIHSKVTKMRGAEKHLLPDGHGNQKEYQCQPMWRLLVNSYDLWKLKEMGFNPHRLDISEMKQPQRSALQFVSVESVEVTGRYDKTYCFTEPKRHMGVFNGILTGQCTEIYQYSSPTETAVCNLASICLPRFITTTRPKQADKFYGAAGFDTRLLPTGEAKPMWFDFAKLHRVVHRLVRNLNKVIDINYYPIPETKRSNFRHRPMGIGVQGLADLYTMLRMPFDSEAAQKLNFYIFESIYYAALEASANEAARYKSQSLDILQKRLARMQAKLPASSDDAMFLEDYQAVTVEMEKIRKQIAVLNRPYGGAYASYEGSPISKGLLQFDLWNKEQEPQGRSALLYPLSLDWTILRALIAEHGVRNSLLLAPMPTGSTSTVMNCSACFEPHNSLVFKRRNRVGEVTIVNKYLIQDLMEIGMWNEDVRNAILKDPRGSIADIARIPRNVRQLYKTVWDVDAKAIVDQALCRGVFVDQSQSMSLFMQRPTHKELTKLHFYSWRRGIKTASYYTRRLAPADAQKIQVVESNKKDEAMTCPRDPKAAAECLSCQ